MIDWKLAAKQLGYEDETTMWKDLYVVRALSIARLSIKLGVCRNTIRDNLKKAGLEIRPRGGPNNEKFELTDAILADVKLRGIAPVAKELGVTYACIYKRLYKMKGVRVEEGTESDSPSE